LNGLRLRSGDRYESSFPLETPPLVLGGAEYPVLLPKGVTLLVERLTGGYLVTVSADATVYGPCTRCLREAAVVIHAEEKEFAPSAAGGWKESELSAFIDDLVVDVAGIAREAVVLALPAQMLCSPDCAGLCPQCGKDLNEGPCGCDGTPRP